MDDGRNGIEMMKVDAFLTRQFASKVMEMLKLQ
jgi:hypothetical protein